MIKEVMILLPWLVLFSVFDAVSLFAVRRGKENFELKHQKVIILKYVCMLFPLSY